MPVDPQYNWIYKELVEGPDDVAGALAYVLYKNEKIAYIESFAKDKNRQPDADDLSEFHRMTNLPDRLESYQHRAEALLEIFLDKAMAAQLKEYELQVRDDEIVKAVKTGFWVGVWQNILAGAITTVITSVALIFIWMYAEGPSKILTGAANKIMGSDAAASAPAAAASAK